MWGLLGLGGDDVSPVGVDFAETSPAFSVVGPPGSGRNTTLAAPWPSPCWPPAPAW
ncbi:hypothetical protein E4N62_06610 [Streptomyces sp. MNU76]|uniref:hypothetical protein n=1 Tax=Streptomyces sp. MNU76 TaxID=2560026 RepID=UPI001E4AC5E4|nr:hypothetical protein [Streptomyces sp. MNU76]MCC9704953.1 hypothetical protein [Streptomyces sp. MNU76]